jgi:hypothetical protein
MYYLPVPLPQSLLILSLKNTFSLVTTIRELNFYGDTCLFILEALPLHDVAPVTSGVANRQEDHPVLASCPDGNIINQLKPVLRSRNKLVPIRIGASDYGSGSGSVPVHLTNGSGFRRPKTTRIGILNNG